MRQIRALTDTQPAMQAEGLSTLYRPFTERLRAVVQYAGPVTLPSGTVYSMGYVDDGMRGGGPTSFVLVRTTAEGSAILETPAEQPGERDAYSRAPEAPGLDAVTAYIADVPAILSVVRNISFKDPVLAAALRQSPLTNPGPQLC